MSEGKDTHNSGSAMMDPRHCTNLAQRPRVDKGPLAALIAGRIHYTPSPRSRGWRLGEAYLHFVLRGNVVRCRVSTASIYISSRVVYGLTSASENPQRSFTDQEPQLNNEGFEARRCPAGYSQGRAIPLARSQEIGDRLHCRSPPLTAGRAITRQWDPERCPSSTPRSLHLFPCLRVCVLIPRLPRLPSILPRQTAAVVSASWASWKPDLGNVVN